MAKIVKLYFAKEVPSYQIQTDDVNSVYVPAEGKSLRLLKFYGDAAFSQNIAVVLVWDYGGVNKLLWSIKGSQKFNQGDLDIEVPATDTDGEKKLALALDNGISGLVYLSGYATFEEK